MSTKLLRPLLRMLAAIAAATFGTTSNAAYYGSDFDPLHFLEPRSSS